MHADGLACPGLDIGGEAFGKDALRTLRIATAIFVNAQPHGDVARPNWEVGKCSGVGAVDMRRRHLAVRTQARPTRSGCCVNNDRIRKERDLEQTHSFGQVKQGSKVHGQLTTVDWMGFARCLVTIPA